MKHKIYRVTDFAIVAPYTLRVSFDDDTQRVINFEPMLLGLSGELYLPLRDVAVFNQVRLDPEVHTLTWPNGADFDPATLHDWPMPNSVSLNFQQGWQEAQRGEISPVSTLWDDIAVRGT